MAAGPPADPVTLEQQASQAHAGEHGDYRQARLEPTQFKGPPRRPARVHLPGRRNLARSGARRPVAMAIYSRDRDWGAGWALFEAFKASFVPPSA
jgi:hypothetical protein